MQHSSRLTRPASVVALILSIALISLGLIANPMAASAAPALLQCNGIAGAGLNLECDYDIVNNLDTLTNVTSSTVTQRTCQGPAGPPLDPAFCTITVFPISPDLVTSVTQCNGSLAGGSNLICNVNVTNNIVGPGIPDPPNATVWQCDGSGDGVIGVNCNPFPATTVDADVTQCNGSANGGGAAGRVACDVNPSTSSAQVPVTIDQCNGSTAAGSTVTCRASITNNIILQGLPEPAPVQPPAPSPTVSASPSASPVPSVTPVPTVTPIPPRGGGEGPGGDGPGTDGNGDGTNGNGDGSGNGGGGGGGDGNGDFGTAGAGSGSGITGSGSGITNQITNIPRGGAAAGGGSTSGIENSGLLLLGIVLMAGAIPALFLTRPDRIRVPA